MATHKSHDLYILKPECSCDSNFVYLLLLYGGAENNRNLPTGNHFLQKLMKGDPRPRWFTFQFLCDGSHRDSESAPGKPSGERMFAP